MESIYVFLGENQLQIDEAIDEIVRKSGVDKEFSRVRYSGDEVPVEEIIEDCRTEPFFDEKKVVIINHPVFLTGNKSLVDHHVESFLDYLKRPNERTILIVNACGYSLDKRLKITKELLKIAKVSTYDAFNEEAARGFVQNKLNEKGKRIDRKALEELIARTECDAHRLQQELEKIFFFLDDETNITYDLIDLLVSEPLETNIFKLTNEIIEGKIVDAIRTYHKLIKQNEEPIVFSSVLAKNFHLLYVIKDYQKKGYTEYQLRSVLKIHPYQLKKLYQVARRINEQKICDSIVRLAAYDRSVKTGKIDKYLGFELFILNQS